MERPGFEPGTGPAAQVEALRLSLQEERAKSARLQAALTTALERQAATSEILSVISGSPADVQPVFEAIADSAMRLFDAWATTVFQHEGGLVRLVAARGGPSGSSQSLLEQLGTPRPVTEDYPPGRAVLTRTVQHIVDAAADTFWGERFRKDARLRGFRSVVTVPMRRGDEVLGVIGINRERAGGFTPDEIALVETFASQAVIAIENTRLLSELQARNAELTAALEQQTATSEILRVISGSPTDIRPVLEAVARSATHLCEAYDAFIALREGSMLRVGAHHGPIPILWRTTSQPLDRGWVSGRAVIDSQVVHVRDLAASADEFPLGHAGTASAGHRTALGVPLLREGQAIGVILIRRLEIRPFTDQQITLLQTFADQAVIAIENVRLFTELEARNRELTDALDRQTATADILQTISQAQTDLQPVFEAIADSAMRLFGAWSSAIFQHEGGLVRLVAARGGPSGSSESILAQFRAPRPATDDYPPGRAVLTRTVQHISDAATDAVWGERFREDARLRGFRSAVAVCCWSDSARSSVRFCTSSNSRTFSIAITAWSAKVSTSSICLSVKARASLRCSAK